ncbi:hypothetical protein MHU86_22216 [Fragilaria crotonensis]|nr:hypothetical protein MHU86_22216 [Fragilaria crotonensis]
MLEEKIKEEFAFKEDLTEEEQLLVKQDEDAKHFLIMSCRGDAFAIIESQETAFKMYQALKNRYDSKKTKDLVKATTKLEKCFMKHDFDDPYIWILEMERLNRDVEKCENGIKRSDEQMQATILSRLPKRRYESVITSLNGKIGSNDFTYDDFVSEIYVHYEMFIEPYKNRFAEQTKGKHLALNTVSGKGGWKAFKGKCNKCGKQGHKARDCNSTEEKNEDSEVEVFEVIDLTASEVDLTESDDEEVEEIVKKPEKKNDPDLFNENEKTEQTRMKRGLFYETDEEEDTDQTEYSEEHGQYGNVVNGEFYIYSGSTCSTSVERGTEIIVNETNEKERNDTKDMEKDAEDIKEKDMESTGKMGALDISDKDMEQNHDTQKEEQVYMVFRAQRETKLEFPKWRSKERDKKESWLMDSGATTHVATNSKMMTNVRTAMNGQFVRVGNNATMQATAIGDLTLMQGGTNKKMFLKDVMVVPNFAKNLISVGRLTDHGNAYATDKTGARLTNENEDVLNFEKGTDGMFYFFATRVKEGKEVNNVEGSNEKGSETKKMRKEMDINEAHRLGMQLRKWFEKC